MRTLLVALGLTAAGTMLPHRCAEAVAVAVSAPSTEQKRFYRIAALE